MGDTPILGIPTIGDPQIGHPKLRSYLLAALPASCLLGTSSMCCCFYHGLLVDPTTSVVSKKVLSQGYEDLKLLQPPVLVDDDADDDAADDVSGQGRDELKAGRFIFLQVPCSLHASCSVVLVQT